jgi:uncharacterized membrane protein
MNKNETMDWWKVVSDRVRQRDVERQLLYNHVRKAVVDFCREHRAWIRTPPLLREFLKTLLGSVLGFWIISGLLAYVFGATPLYSFVAFGFVFSLQATYYKYRLFLDPEYKIPKCGCASAGKDATEVVLQSRESAILKIPNSALGCLLYAGLAVLIYAEYSRAAMLITALAVIVNSYLGYVMIVRLAGLCSICINIFALNMLILWQLFL